MFIKTENEIISLMPTARWNRPQQLYGYLEEEERVALEPLLGTQLYIHLCNECDRLRGEYTDITATTIDPTGKARKDARVNYAHVTDRLDDISEGNLLPDDGSSSASDEREVGRQDMQTVQLLHICQQIEFYKMLSHKAGLLTVSFNEGGGMNIVSADGYDPADNKQMDRVVKDAYMSAGRAVDSLLLFLEADAKSDRFFTELWSHADAFYLHRDLLFQTARVLNEYLDIKGERMTYVSLVRDIRFCQNTYIKPRIGAKLLKAIINYANGTENSETDSSSSSSSASTEAVAFTNGTADELLSLLRTALGFYVDSRRTSLTPAKERLLTRDSMTDAQQAMAMACQFIEDHLDDFGNDYLSDSPIYKAAKEREAKKLADEQNAEQARQRQCREAREQQNKKLFTAFPMTHRTPPQNIK